MPFVRGRKESHKWREIHGLQSVKNGLWLSGGKGKGKPIKPSVGVLTGGHDVSLRCFLKPQFSKAAFTFTNHFKEKIVGIQELICLWGETGFVELKGT